MPLVVTHCLWVIRKFKSSTTCLIRLWHVDFQQFNKIVDFKQFNKTAYNSVEWRREEMVAGVRIGCRKWERANWNLPLSTSHLDSLLAIGHYWRMGSEQLKLSFPLIIIVLFCFIKFHINNLFQGSIGCIWWHSIYSFLPIFFLYILYLSLNFSKRV